MSDPEQRISLRNIEADGDVAGRDIHKHEHEHVHRDIHKHEHVHLPEVAKNTYLNKLYGKLEEEKRDGIVKAHKNDLDDWLTTPDDKVMGLEAKLQKGGIERPEQLLYAASSKEKYTQHLDKYVMYESACKIHSFLIDRVESSYISNILPHLAETTPSDKLALVRQKVSAPIEAELGDNLLDLTPKHIDGIVFFLTGKCRLSWSA